MLKHDQGVIKYGGGPIYFKWNRTPNGHNFEQNLAKTKLIWSFETKSVNKFQSQMSFETFDCDDYVNRWVCSAAPLLPMCCVFVVRA